MDKKKLNAVCGIKRAMGIIEGLARGMPEEASMLAARAVELIEEALEVLLDAT